jgi:hypothetical protein
MAEEGASDLDVGGRGRLGEDHGEKNSDGSDPRAEPADPVTGPSSCCGGARGVISFWHGFDTSRVGDRHGPLPPELVYSGASLTGVLR